MISDLFAAGKPTVSLEVFPPKKNEEFKAAYETLDAMAALKPDFISITYGAGGSRAANTVELSSYIQNRLHIDALAHITCVGCRRDDIRHICDELSSSNIKHVLALRGDRPKDMTDEQFDSREFSHASDMVSYLRANTELEIAGACYPEKHFEAPDMKTDIGNLQKKISAGVSFLITQLFFDNDVFYSFEDTLRESGTSIPICAGIMPVTSARQLGTTVNLSGSSVPKKLSDVIAKYGDSADDMRKAGIDFAINQILDLMEHGVHDIHIYSMNKPQMTAEIINAIR
jgi:5,10-methylenetetrahydrofolate reductase